MYPFRPVIGDITNLPFADDVFDKRFHHGHRVHNGCRQGDRRAVTVMTNRGGCLVVATLNRLGSWAVQRKKEPEWPKPDIQRSLLSISDELSDIVPLEGVVKTAIHFQRNDDPKRAMAIESEGRQKGLRTGAFVIGRWVKP